MSIFLSSKENQLIKIYEQSLISLGTPLKDAKKMAVELMRMAQKSLSKSKEDKLPENFGEIILTDLRFKENLEKGRKEGVTDNDVREWFNLDPPERHLMKQMDDFNRTTLIIR